MEHELSARSLADLRALVVREELPVRLSGRRTKADILEDIIAARSTRAPPPEAAARVAPEQAAPTGDEEAPTGAPAPDESLDRCTLRELRDIVSRENLPVCTHVGGATRRTKADIADEIGRARDGRGPTTATPARPTRSSPSSRAAAAAVAAPAAAAAAAAATEFRIFKK